MIAIMSNALYSALCSLAPVSREIEKGTYLFHQGDPVQSVFVVASGCIELTRFQEDGKPLVLQRAVAQSFLAEASVYSQAYHCDAIVTETGAVHEMKRADFRKLLVQDADVSDLWASHLAGEVQAARYKSEILSRKTVAERLTSWLTWKNGQLPEKGAWKSVAHQIGVSPEALYRELAKRRG